MHIYIHTVYCVYINFRYGDTVYFYLHISANKNIFIQTSSFLQLQLLSSKSPNLGIHVLES